MHFQDGRQQEIQTSSQFPTASELGRVARFEEKLILATFIFPQQHLGSVHQLCFERRGIQTDYFCQLNDGRIITKFIIPLGEILTDFYSCLQRITSGFCSLDYEDAGYGKVELSKLVLTMNKIEIDEFTTILPTDNAIEFAKNLVKRVKQLMTRHLFEIDIRAVLNGRIVATERLHPFRKDVTSKCYGGDASRRAKLLENQKEGKKRMKLYGKIEVPRSLLIEVVKAQFSP